MKEAKNDVVKGRCTFLAITLLAAFSSLSCNSFVLSSSLGSQKHRRISESSRFSISTSTRTTTVDGPTSPKPDYANIHGPLGKQVDDFFLSVFQTKMAEHIFGADDNKIMEDGASYQGLMELSLALNARYSDRRQVQEIAQNILKSLFPSWLPFAFSKMFAEPFPKFSSRMNAWATKMAGTWLMGECEINDVPETDIFGEIGYGQGLLVKRCRFLEESNCASICVNSCKIPTQRFFMDDMGLPLTMTPNYNTFECQFSFGKTPDPVEEFEAKNTPCLSKCPSAGGMRSWHNNYGAREIKLSTDENTKRCMLMENTQQ